jgi:pyridoxal phosphate enzyme (YggS family)
VNGPGDIAARLAAIRARIAAAAARAGRDPGEVTLVGASKQQPIEALHAAHAAGLRCFGENRVQEGATKQPRLPADIEWHLLGPLQSNKVRAAASIFDVFHAIDRVKIARALDAEATGLGRPLIGLLEVNLGGESSKHGFDPATLADEAATLVTCRNLRLAGLMAIPPPADDPEGSRRWFRRLRELRDELARRLAWPHPFTALSMGMSDDFEVAVEEGATHVRVGTLLFGSRPPLG